MESAYKEDEKEQVSGEDGKEQEHKKIHTEETEAECVILLTDSHARLSSSSSSSSSAYSSPPRNLPETSNEEDAEICSPGVQVMERGSNKHEHEGVYDPNRIPSSVFARDKSSTPAEWSCASNESLFSIHLGHNSFSVRGADLMRSGELYKSGELLAYSPALPMPPPPGAEPIIHEEEVDSDSDSDSDKEEQVLVIGKEENEEDKRESHEKEQHPAVSWKTPSTSYRSNRSSNSTHSFSFPILAGAASESGKTKTETEKEKKQYKESVASEEAPSEAANPKQPTSFNRWFSCFPPCPWCYPSRPP